VDLAVGYLNGKLGRDMMYKFKPNHIGIPVGEVIGYNANKGHVKIKLSKELNLGDSIAINDASCKISELMQGNNNIKSANIGQVVKLGRIKGKILNGDKVYKTVSDKLNKEIIQKSSKENIKRPVIAKIYLKENEKIKLELEDLWSNIKVKVLEDTIVNKADNNGITKQRIEEQLSKTGNTPFEIKEIQVILDSNVIVPISSLNSIRRTAIEELQNKILDSFKRSKQINLEKKDEVNNNYNSNVNVSLLLNQIKEEINYCKLEGIDNIYIPFKLFLSNQEKIKEICTKFNTYMMFPAITKSNYETLIQNNLESVLKSNIKGIVVSNLSHLEILNRYKVKDLEIIANYTLNITNNNTVKELENFGVSKYIVPPELDKEAAKNLGGNIKKEVIVYGRTLLMTSEYCTIGTLKNCPAICEKGTYKLKDRMGFEFPIYTDRINCNNLIYNSKITSISWKELNANSIRIDILEENEQEIQNIINVHKKGDRLEGENYTNGNLNRDI